MKLGHLKYLYKKLLFLKMAVSTVAILIDIDQGYLEIGRFMFACYFTHLESPGYMRDIIQNYIR